MITQLKNNSLEDFDKQCSQIIKNYPNEIQQAKEVIVFIEETLKQLANWLKTHAFENRDLEIIFFKEIRPKIVAKLIFYKEVLLLIAALPIDKNKQAKHYEKKMNSINQFFRKHTHFFSYIKSQATYYDEIYFTRTKYKDLFQNDCTVINQDAKLCTSHDYLLAEMMANELLSNYIEKKVVNLNNPTSTANCVTSIQIKWTAKKIDLIELIYALQQSKAINNGQSDIKELTLLFEKIFHIDLGENITRSFIDIKNRKSEQTRFLKQLQMALDSKIEHSNR